jgi:hypothetical protein
VCSVPDPVTVADSSVGTVSVRLPVTVVVPFMCSVPAPLKVDPVCSVTAFSRNVAPAATVKCPLLLRAVVLTTPLWTSTVPVFVYVAQPLRVSAPVPTVLRSSPALVKVWVPQPFEVKVRSPCASHTPSLSLTTALLPWK